MKGLKDSGIFSKLVMSPQITTVLQNLQMRDLNKLSLEKDLNNEYNIIERKINCGTKGAIFDCVNTGKIVIINETDKLLKLPNYLSTIGVKKNNSVMFIVNINSFTNGNGEIFPKTLYALLQNALISYVLFENWNKVINYTELMKDASFSYSRIMSKILDKLFAVDLDPFKSDFISYVFSKFFLITMCGKSENDVTNSIAYRSCFNQSNLDLIKDFESKMGDDFYKDTFTFFESLKNINGLVHLNIRSFIENFVKMYGEASLLAIDYLPAFLHMILSSSINGNIVKDYIVDSVAGRSDNKCLNDFIKIL